MKIYNNFVGFFKKFNKNATLAPSKEQGKMSRDKEKEKVKNKEAAKERLHLVLMQDRANVSADFLDLMKQEIIDVIKKYIDVDESKIDVKLTNKENSDGTVGSPALYANIPIKSIKKETRKRANAKQLKTISEAGKKQAEKTKNTAKLNDIKKAQSNIQTSVKQNANKGNDAKNISQQSNSNNMQNQNKKTENPNNKTKDISKKK